MKKSFQNFALTGCILILAFASCKKNSPSEPEKAKSETVKENVATELAKKTEVATFAEAFKNIVLTDDEVNEGLTILAPTNEALKDYRPRTSFSKNSIKLLADTNVEKLTQERLKDHIVKGILTKADFTHGKILISLSGKELKVTVEGDKISINGVELTLVSSSGSQMIYTIPEVLTNTESKIYLPVKISYTIDDTINAGITNIAYVGNTSLIASVEDNMFKEEFVYNEGKIQKATRFQKNGASWIKRYDVNYEINGEGEISRMNIMRADTLNDYMLVSYNSSQKVSLIKYYNTHAALSHREANYEYDVKGNVVKFTDFYPGGDKGVVGYQYDNRNGIFKHVKNQALLINSLLSDGIFYMGNNVVKNQVDNPGMITFENTNYEYNDWGYPVKYIKNSSTSSVPVTITIEYDVK
ncbi:fasciclin domain-containing protein [Pseudopedobacter beijingensis]|uniref:Fasciclin domain-containing protein n=1 Tax=Pseudopedobacter beijingensis TaxID=1207056 RepID=A0ABW4I991_9SPHI